LTTHQAKIRVKRQEQKAETAALLAKVGVDVQKPDTKFGIASLCSRFPVPPPDNTGSATPPANMQPPSDDTEAPIAYSNVSGQHLPFGQWFHEWQSAEPRDLSPAEHAKLPPAEQRRFKLMSSLAQFKRTSVSAQKYLEHAPSDATGSGTGSATGSGTGSATPPASMQPPSDDTSSAELPAS
jgi:hypothetical protein